MNFIDIHCDLGGASISLEAHGYTCIGSFSWKQILSSKSACNSELLQAAQSNPTQCDLLSLQAPTYDTVSGYWDSEGNWISMRNVVSIVRDLLRKLNPQSVILTGRKNLLSERNGTSFAELLLVFSELSYETTWLRLNLLALGVPQDSLRVGVVAQRRDSHVELGSSGILAGDLFSSLLRSISGHARLGSSQDLEKFIATRRPRAGLRLPAEKEPFGSVGVAWAGNFQSGALQISKNTSSAPSLAQVLGIDGARRLVPTLSVRFVSRTGVKGLQFKKGECAHSIGPSISAWPLLAISDKDAAETEIPRSYYNWQTSAFGYSIFRATPIRALLLFGMEASCLGYKLRNMSLPTSEQYKMIAATVSPALLSHLIETMRWMHRCGNAKMSGEA